MVRIKDDSGTHTKCLLDPFDEEATQLEAAARDTDWEREIRYFPTSLRAVAKT